MTNDPASDAALDALPPRKPRVALMGEFSAGKSTLTNLLLGGTPLPVKVTATRLPPVWISHGEPAVWREDVHGNVIPIDTAHLGDVQLEDTRLVRMTMEEDVLDMCDLIDMPGISDPNMPPEIWERILHEADHVIWCTHATQAWRQSEAAVWETVPEELRGRSLLLITRIDKIAPGRDRDRLLARVRHETRGLFADFFPISLTDAMKAGDDAAKWVASGAEAFMRRLVALVDDPEAPPLGTYEQGGPATAAPAPIRNMARNTAREGDNEIRPEDCEKVIVLPRRVVPVTGEGSRRPRPPARRAGPGRA